MDSVVDTQLGKLDALNESAAMAGDAIARSRAEHLLDLVAIDEVEAFRRDGAPSLSTWLRTRSGLPAVDASRLVRLVRLLRRLPELACVLRDGGTTIFHVEALERVATGRRVEFLNEFAEQLARHATNLGHRDFAEVCHRWAEHADNQLDAPEDEPSDRWLHLTPSLFGAADLRGHLTADQAAVVGEALDALGGPDPANAPIQRSVAERRADALADLASAFLGRTDASESSARPAARATGVVTIGIDDLLETARSTPVPSNDGTWHDQIDLASIRRDLLGLGPVSTTVAELLLCDASVKRLVLDQHGQPLNIGRATRVVSPAQRQALAVRDGGCVFPTCDRPAAWCDAHHVVPWSRGGPTDLTNLVLLCRHHHRLVHGHEWHLERHPDTGRIRVVRADGTIYQRDPIDDTLVIYNDARRPDHPPNPPHVHEPWLAELLWPS